MAGEGRTYETLRQHGSIDIVQVGRLYVDAVIQPTSEVDGTPTVVLLTESFATFDGCSPPTEAVEQRSQLTSLATSKL